MPRFFAAFTCLAFAGLALAAPPVAATVNGESIPVSAIDAVLAERPPIAIPLSISQQKQLKLEVLSGLIDDLLMRQYLAQHAPPIDPSEFEKHFAAFRAETEKLPGGLTGYLSETKQTEAQLRYNLMGTLQMARYADSRCTDEALRKYYAANKDYFDRVTVRASHIVIRISDEAPAEDRAAARKRLSDLRTEILAGKLDFAEAAKRYSQCPSANKGGDVGTFTAKWMSLDEAFVKAAFALKVGELSDIVATDYGLHLIKVTERSPGSPSAYETSRDEVKDCFIEDLRSQLLNQLRKTANIQIHLP